MHGRRHFTHRICKRGHLKRACISYKGELTSLYEYIPRMRKSNPEEAQEKIANGVSSQRTYNILVSLSGHLFDKFLINEALDMIEAAGGSFHLAKCKLGQSADAESYSELEVGADDKRVLDQIIDSLTRLANPDEDYISPPREANKISLKIGKVQQEKEVKEKPEMTKKSGVLIIGAGRVCRPAAEFLASVRTISSQQWYKTYFGAESEEQRDVRVIVASMYLKDAKKTIEGIPDVETVQLDVSDSENLLKYVSEVDVVLSLLPASCHAVVAKTCIELKKHLVTASYVDDETSMLHEKAKTSGITILGEMGLDPGIDHMMAMKMINEAHIRKGKVKSFTSYCGGLPSPAAANNPLAYKFSWSPAGAIRAGRNPAKYKSNGDVVNVDGENLYDSATSFRVPNLPAFALECLPNRNSLVYGEFYGIESEATTIFRGTLRYEGFSMIMATLSKLGFFDNEANQVLSTGKKITFGALLSNFLKKDADNDSEPLAGEEEISKRIIKLGHTKETATKAAKTIVFLGFNEEREIPSLCKSVFDATCYLMEEKLAYSGDEQDMVLLHHEVEVEFPESKRVEKHSATLLEFGDNKNGQTTTAMAKTVGIPAAIGALLLIEDKIKTRGVLRPLEPEVYLPALDILQAYGIKLIEKTE
ncbi:PREDICTED: alpha-aminoadipic semialdehyde synthase-like isoform X2 [Camelina sativa]|uniref:Alpha-aminoadipic semialdehyde synthase-like isoform X2 n=1 Tax=Camelina sativa TaxID=90675 RepID=A0ABM0U977_CAMSA|nr:PREDICTED: alpha-aminoadipic semialdehyde synthase-like isoform X2 [Camelina sativa]